MKKCKHCSYVGGYHDFKKDSRCKDGHVNICLDCDKTYHKTWLENNRERRNLTNKQWRQNNPEKTAAWAKDYASRHPGKATEAARKHHLKNSYGMSEKDYQDLLILQGGVCLGCLSKPLDKLLCVDHNHKTGKVRGLLCSKCNSCLGQAGDNPEVLRSLANYLEKGFYAAQWSRPAIKSILETSDVNLWDNPIITDVDISNDRVE